MKDIVEKLKESASIFGDSRAGKTSTEAAVTITNLLKSLDTALEEIARLQRELAEMQDKRTDALELANGYRLGEIEARARRPVVCPTCDWSSGVATVADGCHDCGKDGCGPGVRYE